MSPQDELPPGWEMRVDPASGRCYFVDHNNKATQWKHPITNKIYFPREYAEETFAESSKTQVENEVKSDSNEVKSESNENIVSEVLLKARSLQPEIDKFQGTKHDKDYMRLAETLEQLILKLDAIQLDGNETIRSMRKSAVKEIQQLIEMLDFRVQISEPNGHKEEPVSLH